MEKESKESDQLRLIPQLPVSRGDVCPQAVVDSVIDELRKNSPHLLLNLSHYPRFGAGENQCLMDIKAKVRDIVTRLSLPQNPLMYIYLIHEIRRRIRVAYGQEEQILPIGHSLAPHLKGPFPPLSEGMITKDMEKLGFKQAEVDDILAKYYADYPEWWFVMAEYMRFLLPLNPVILCPADEEYFERLLDGKRFSEHIHVLISILNWDVSERLKSMCGIPK
ncbi:MAG: hypothetical protein WC043_07695 [Pseudobdellovibrionaceae bacterium]